MTKPKNTGTTEPKAQPDACRTAIILIRGLGREQAHWGGFPDALRASCDQGCQIFSIDLPGNGDYVAHPSPVSLAPYAEFLQARLNALPLGHYRDVRLVAISMGAMAVLKWLEGRDESVIDRFYLINTSCGQFSPFYRRLIPSALPYLSKYLTTSDIEVRERSILQLVSNNEDARKTYLPDWVAAHKRRASDPSNLARQMMASASFQALGSIPLAERITMVGSKADRMVHYTCGQAIARHLGCPLVLHERTGHDLPLDDPDWLSQLVTLGLADAGGGGLPNDEAGGLEGDHRDAHGPATA